MFANMIVFYSIILYSCDGIHIMNRKTKQCDFADELNASLIFNDGINESRKKRSTKNIYIH